MDVMIGVGTDYLNHLNTKSGTFNVKASIKKNAKESIVLGLSFLKKVKKAYKLADRISDAQKKAKKAKGTGKGLETRGYKPKSGERTFDGYVKKNVPADKETTLHTNSKGFNNNSRGSNPDGQFKRFGSDSRAGLSPHVHQPTRNVNKNGDIFGGQGSKTQGGGVTSPGKKDASQLYYYLNNGKYRR